MSTLAVLAAGSRRCPLKARHLSASGGVRSALLLLPSCTRRLCPGVRNTHSGGCAAEVPVPAASSSDSRDGLQNPVPPLSDLLSLRIFRQLPPRALPRQADTSAGRIAPDTRACQIPVSSTVHRCVDGTAPRLPRGPAGELARMHGVCGSSRHVAQVPMRLSSTKKRDIHTCTPESPAAARTSRRRVTRLQSRPWWERARGGLGRGS